MALACSCRVCVRGSGVVDNVTDGIGMQLPRLCGSGVVDNVTDGIGMQLLRLCVRKRRCWLKPSRVRCRRCLTHSCMRSLQPAEL